MIVACSLILGIFGWITYIIILIETWRFYAILLGFVVLFYVVITFAYPERIIHFHHWTIGLTMAIFLCNQDWITAGMHGFFNGMCVEGGAHWGFDGVWLRKPEPVPEEEQEKVNEEQSNGLIE